MESNYSNRDFEQYVKKNADEYRMFPSEKVWKGVHNALHTRKRWPGIGLAFLLLVTGGAVTWVMTTYPTAKKEEQTTIAHQSQTENKKNQPTSTEEATRKLNKILALDQSPSIPGNDLSEETNSTTSPSETDIPVNSKTDLAAAGTLDGTVSTQQSPLIVKELNDRAFFTNLNLASPATQSLHDRKVETIAIAPEEKQISSVTGSEQALVVNKAPLTIESVVNSYRYQKPSKHLTWQLFFTPTVSYRRLSLNKAYENSTVPTYPFITLTDVNEAVTHKPDIGFQLGFSAAYPVTKAIKIRAGLQANVNRYDIKAFAYNGEVATINLNSGAGASSVSTWTNYRNYGGYKTDWIKNYYLSISIPIGAEVILFGNSKTNFGIAGTIQPTYVVSDRAYLISTDYKNYAKVPSLIRDVNVSTGFETFINYDNGRTKWQIGPQVRYQMLSSFQNKYPVKENLFDFGLKIGVILNE